MSFLVFPVSYKSSFHFYNYHRANQSQLNFATGLFDRLVAQSDVQYEPAVDPDDPIIRFYKVCKKWKTEVKNNPVSKEQQRLFEQSEKVRSRGIRNSISRVNITTFDHPSVYQILNS